MSDSDPEDDEPELESESESEFESELESESESSEPDPESPSVACGCCSEEPDAPSVPKGVGNGAMNLITTRVNKLPRQISYKERLILFRISYGILDMAVLEAVHHMG